ncbi:hypothetical protein NQ315_004646 [Exocentrus adspersus]|uniref:Kinesin motor domain-containing protein n=1 Tax=Exocentrus adspersus TaxID=1586481 RepID=A0AAV8VNM1_9CUCU|nr:hypothetical protein NQ315_004646 [Exocentrus adspersus]
MDQGTDEFVNVSIRIRPVLNQDSTESSCLQVISKQPPVLFVLDRSETYHFDNIFTADVDQETVYNKTVKPLVEYVKQGYSCTVFAYGQTGTGKTYTMGTSNQNTLDMPKTFHYRPHFDRTISNDNKEI